MRASTHPARAEAVGGHLSSLAPLTRRGVLAALVLFILLAVLHTWPLASAPGTLSRHDNGDAVLNEWALAWVAHQLPRNPLRLFDANIFYPERNTLAFSEHLFVQAMLGAPLLWAGAPTLLVHNLLLIGGFALTGWTMCLVMWRFTGDRAAAIAGGMLLAFNAHTLGRIAHLQAVHVEFLPLAILSLDRVLRRPTVPAALMLGLLVALQCLTSNYLLVFMVFAMGAAAAVRAPEWIGRDRSRTLGMLAIAGAVTAVLVLPFLLPYQQAQRHQGLTRSLPEVATYAATWRDYLSASGRLHFEWWSSRYWNGTSLFPGVTALLLVLVSVATGAAWRHRFGRMWLAIGVVGVLLSFGTALPGYSILYHAVPVLQGIRATVRFGFLLLVGVAALAALGLAILRARLVQRPRLSLALASLALLLVTLEAIRAPIGYVQAHHTPRVYRFLAGEPEAVVVELPLYPPYVAHRNSHYMLHSTVHWRPMLNGYSGYRPASYFRHYDELRAFPDAPALAYLRSLRVTHIVVHAGLFAELWGLERLAEIDETPALRTMVKAGGLAIYRLEPEGE